jgi:hypothetical protein
MFPPQKHNHESRKSHESLLIRVDWFDSWFPFGFDRRFTAEVAEDAEENLCALRVLCGFNPKSAARTLDAASWDNLSMNVVSAHAPTRLASRSQRFCPF